METVPNSAFFVGFSDPQLCGPVPHSKPHCMSKPLSPHNSEGGLENKMLQRKDCQGTGVGATPASAHTHGLNEIGGGGGGLSPTLPFPRPSLRLLQVAVIAPNHFANPPTTLLAAPDDPFL